MDGTVLPADPRLPRAHRNRGACKYARMRVCGVRKQKGDPTIRCDRVVSAMSAAADAAAAPAPRRPMIGVSPSHPPPAADDVVDVAHFGGGRFAAAGGGVGDRCTPSGLSIHFCLPGIRLRYCMYDRKQKRVRDFFDIVWKPPKNVDRLISEYVDRLRYIR